MHSIYPGSGSASTRRTKEFLWGLTAVKHDGQHKAWIVTSAHLTQPASVYSAVVSICSICLVLLASELNNLTIYQANVGKANLEAYTKELFILLLEKNSIHSEWRVTSSLYLKLYMGYA